jgi:hypothetical protein
MYNESVHNTGSKRQWGKNIDPFSPIPKYHFPQWVLDMSRNYFNSNFTVLYVDDNISVTTSFRNFIWDVQYIC